MDKSLVMFAQMCERIFEVGRRCRVGALEVLQIFVFLLWARGVGGLPLRRYSLYVRAVPSASRLALQARPPVPRLRSVLRTLVRSSVLSISGGCYPPFGFVLYAGYYPAFHLCPLSRHLMPAIRLFLVRDISRFLRPFPAISCGSRCPLRGILFRL